MLISIHYKLKYNSNTKYVNLINLDIPSPKYYAPLSYILL